jgi:hypothetical protein
VEHDDLSRGLGLIQQIEAPVDILELERATREAIHGQLSSIASGRDSAKGGFASIA